MHQGIIRRKVTCRTKQRKACWKQRGTECLQSSYVNAAALASAAGTLDDQHGTQVARPQAV